MKENNVKNIVFSSSATVYGDPQYLPLDEKHPVGGCTNPYGKTKYFIEEFLSDVCKADKVSRVKVYLTTNLLINAHKSNQKNVSILLPPASVVCEGYVFTRVCRSFCSGGGACVLRYSPPPMTL